MGVVRIASLVLFVFTAACYGQPQPPVAVQKAFQALDASLLNAAAMLIRHHMCASLPGLANLARPTQISRSMVSCYFLTKHAIYI
jgi:hypothetical protein